MKRDLAESGLDSVSCFYVKRHCRILYRSMDLHPKSYRFALQGVPDKYRAIYESIENWLGVTSCQKVFFYDRA